ncbi:hypothetical protein [Gilliamella apis]|uniref:hypothetical protein n=1 Tax=Gilliamella apis TaxID=1970738 RepID=UPI000D8F8551|nr:hypothetical protein [Gilliamella apis]PXY93253.1 hypothetical protein DKK77_07090 [Gilliamella apis]WLS97245.1 hypothetical protein RAM03_05085 [Gilliamella apis]
MVLVLTVVVLQFISFANYALTTKTTNIIYGSAPYLTFDGGRTRVTNSEALLGISLSDGRTFTPTTNNSSSTNPIELPVAGQSFNDIGMLVPRDTDSIALSSLIGTPYNYWGDDDGDGQGIDGITATGSLNVSIVDKYNRAVTRNEVLTICKAPYKLTLSNGEGTLTTRYGIPNESRFSASNATYYIKPKASPAVCFAKPNADYINRGLSDDIYNNDKGFLPQSVTPSSYGLNFPTTGAHNLYFDLDIGGINAQALSWAPVSHGGITATMTESPYYRERIRVTLTGPVATPSQWRSDNPGQIARLSLPQVFELVGRDSSGNAVVKYGFVLKQWFVNRGNYESTHSSIESWCNKIGGYRMPKVMDLTNATCQGEGSNADCQGAVGATPSSPDSRFRRHIGAGFFTEWGGMYSYANANFPQYGGGGWFRYWTQDRVGSTQKFYSVYANNGRVFSHNGNIDNKVGGLCVYP